MNSPQRMRLTQHPAVLHHCLRCQRGTGLQHTARCVKTANTFKLFQFQQKQRCILRSSLMTIKKIAASFTHKKSLLSHLLDLQGVQFFNLKMKR